MSQITINFSCLAPNLSQDSVTASAWRLGVFDDEHVWNVNVIAAFLTLFFVIGLPWNLLVIAAIIKERLYVQPSVILLLNLAIADLLMCLLVMPFNIVSGIAGEFIFGDNDIVRCRVCQTGFILTLLTFSSFHIVTLMSVDRLIYIMKPIEYYNICTVKKTIAVIMIAWLVCLILSILPLFQFGEIHFGLSVGMCVVAILGGSELENNLYYVILLVCEIMVVLLVFIVANVVFVCLVLKHLNSGRKIRKRAFTSSQNSGIQENQKSLKMRNKTQFYLARMFGAVIVTNIVSLIPLIALAIAGATVTFDRIPLGFKSFSYLAFISQTVFHPLIESVMIKDIRRVLQDVLMCRCRCLKQKRIQHLPPSSPKKMIQRHQVTDSEINIVENVVRYGTLYVNVITAADACSERGSSLHGGNETDDVSISAEV